MGVSWWKNIPEVETENPFANWKDFDLFHSFLVCFLLFLPSRQRIKKEMLENKIVIDLVYFFFASN